MWSFSLTATEKNCGGWEREKKKRALLNTNLMYVDENGRSGRGWGVADRLRHNFKALIELPLQLLRLIVAVVCLSVA